MSTQLDDLRRTRELRQAIHDKIVALGELCVGTHPLTLPALAEIVRQIWGLLNTVKEYRRVLHNYLLDD
jgi:hypothetical protein